MNDQSENSVPLMDKENFRVLSRLEFQQWTFNSNVGTKTSNIGLQLSIVEHKKCLPKNHEISTVPNESYHF